MALRRREVWPLSSSASRSASQVSDAPRDQRSSRARTDAGISIASGGAAHSPAISRGLSPAQTEAASATSAANTVRMSRGV